MLGERDLQMDFFTQYAYEHLLPKEHELVRIHRELDFSFVRLETRDLYCDANGRPSWDPEIMFRAVFLQFYSNLSDRDLENHLQVNLLYRWFCGLALTHGTPEASALSVFRSRLGEERFQRIFDRLVQACREKNLLKGGIKRVDATHVLADVALRNMVADPRYVLTVRTLRRPFEAESKA